MAGVEETLKTVDGAAAGREVWTIGHSTLEIPEFLGVLHAYSIEAVVDVRRFPGSRRPPQFGAEALGQSLESQGIAFQWVHGLGGRRRPDEADDEGSAWRHP